MDKKLIGFALMLLGAALFMLAPFSVSGIGAIPYCTPPVDVLNPVVIMSANNFVNTGGFFTDGYSGDCFHQTNGGIACDHIKPAGSSISGTSNSYESCAMEQIPEEIDNSTQNQQQQQQHNNNAAPPPTIFDGNFTQLVTPSPTPVSGQTSQIAGIILIVIGILLVV